MWKYLAALLVVLLALGGLAAATTVSELTNNQADVSAGGSATATSLSNTDIKANGDVSALTLQGTEATAYHGFANVKMESEQSVAGARDVVLESIQGADQEAKKGGHLDMSNSQTTTNSGDTYEFALNTAKQTGGIKAVFVDKLSNSQSGYGADDNEVTGLNDLESTTGPCGKVIAVLTNTKSIDPANVKAWDQNDANIKSGTIDLVEKNKDTIGATNGIDATEKNGATTFSYMGTSVELTNDGRYFSPGNVAAYSSNKDKTVAVLGDADVSEKTIIDINTHPWGPSKPTQMIDIDAFSTADVKSIFEDASSLQDTKTTVH